MSVISKFTKHNRLQQTCSMSTKNLLLLFYTPSHSNCAYMRNWNFHEIQCDWYSTNQCKTVLG